MISISRLNKSYGKKNVLKNLSLQIEKGEVFGFIGSNGAGKSTLLSILATITKPTSGEISIGEFSISKHKNHIRQLIGYVPQEIALLDDLSLKENLLFWSKFAKETVSQEYLFDLCTTVDLANQWDEKVAYLSGGMKRKLNIITALIHNPEILLMDEPTVGIDIQSKLEINHYMRQLAAEGKTIVYITHDINEILYTCDRIAVIKSGGTKFIGAIEDARKYLAEHNVMLHSDEDIVYHLLK